METATISSGQIEVPIPTLNAGASVDITYTSQVSSTPSGAVRNDAEVKIAGGLEDTEPLNNTAFVSLGTGDITDLTIEVIETDNTEKAYSGSTKEFTVTLTNNSTTGPDPASVVVDLANAALYGVGGDDTLVTAISWTCSGTCPAVTTGTGATDPFDMVTSEVATFIVTVTTSSSATGNLTYGASFTVDESGGLSPIRVALFRIQQPFPSTN